MKKFLRSVLLVICLGVMCYSGYQIYSIYSAYSQAEKVYAATTDKFVKQSDTKKPAPDATEPSVPKETAPIEVDFDALLQENEDVVGWIYCPDTTLNYPIVQAQDNDYYLRRMLDGNYNHSGSIFMDYRSDGEFKDHNSIIYGHNMNNDSMFAVLAEYQSEEFYKEHPVMYLLTPDADYRVDVIGVLQTDADSDIYRFPYSEDAYRKFLEDVQDRSVYPIETDLSTVEHSVLLSTCSYEYQDARYLVVGSLKQLDRVTDTPKAQ